MSLLSNDKLPCNSKHSREYIKHEMKIDKLIHKKKDQEQYLETIPKINNHMSDAMRN